jgi:outer membrane protein OmpA-like peptidoglycan-associated protein
MKRQPWILAGSAAGLLIASAPLGAFPLQRGDMHKAWSQLDVGSVIRVQANCAEGAKDCAEEQGKKRQPKKQKREESAPAQRAKPAPAMKKAEPAAEQPKPRAKPQKQAEPAPDKKAEPAPAAKKAQPKAEQPKPRAKPQKQAEPAPAKKVEPAPAAKKAQPEAEQPKPSAKPQQQAEPAPAKKVEPAVPAGKAKPTPATKQIQPQAEQRQPAQPADQASEPKSKKGKVRDYLKKKNQDDEAAPADAKPEGNPQPAAGQKAEQPPKNDQPPKSGQQPAESQPSDTQAKQTPKPQLPTDTRQQAMPKGQPNAKPLPDNAAPLPDSAKRMERKDGDRNGKHDEKSRRADRSRDQNKQGKPGPLPKSDSAAQTGIKKIGRIESVEAMRGERVDRDQWRKDFRNRRHDRRGPDEGHVVREVDNRVIIKFGDNIYVDNRGVNQRLERHARDSYVEELPHGFSRYTIVKDNGARIVTIRNADGDIVRRSRIMPDDREVVLYYVPEGDYGRIRHGYIDAGADLPPLRLDIPANQYILDAQSAEPDDYYTYLDAPPVEPVERIYSVDEVVHSARIRDKVRRVDLDTITFETGSAEIGEDQVNELEGLGEAINKILEQNPAETFLIEGHTDAVGSDESNLVLSDERAQSVAEALTSVFDIPAENLTTQGYGEQYLKVDTQGAARENRRVAVRRITPLVSPVASAQ